MRYLRTINVPDEIAFQTLLAHSPLARTLEGWEDGAFRPEEKRVYLHYVDWDAARENPALLDLGDLPAIRASGQYFVRKVDRGRSVALMDALDTLAGADAKEPAEPVDQAASADDRGPVPHSLNPGRDT
jgi:hypothetical protein